MGIADSVDLNPNHLATVKDILAEHVPECEVRAFGSRTTWTAGDYSDLDIAVIGEGLVDWRTLGRLKEAFEESNLPMRVDVLDWHAISESFREVIERDCVVVQEGSKQTREGEWREVTLGDITELLSGGTPSKSRGEYWNGSVPWASAKDMKRLRLYETEDRVTTAGVENGTRIVPKNTVLVLVRGMTLLKDVPVSVIQRPMAFNQDVKAFRPKPEVAEEFLPYLILGNKARLLDLVDLAGHGTGRLNTEELKAIRVHLPPLPEQRAIAHVLGTLDDKTELNRRMNETLEEMARALFKSWFVDFEPVRAKMEGRWRRGESLSGLPAEHYDLFPNRLVASELGEVPEGWEVRALGEVVELNPRERMKKETIAPYLDMAALPILGPSPDEAVLREFKSGTRFRNGDTLLARITPCLENGKTAFVQSLPEGEVGWGSTEFIVMRAISPVPSEYTYLLARDPTFRAHAIQSMTGTSGRQRARTEALVPYLLPSPPVAVWTQFSSMIESALARIESNRKEALALAAQRDTLLPGLVSGEIGV